ncbi:hypothetical protein C3747_84g52 [Trypanosoma cruzi]|uniref:Uncharacterized protein n=2 Tax=Trypanosoma cruzi TaxID=5693 RepID=Q4DZG1_TRYCC|nr:hypothetical protein, conserved [Trypanosoma cruzi]EAN97893.1 hypothetical protein, conserved [Trypanosoma cruzi]PWV08923.1 hypothetical protein C3747_84g52 [Trypanosoma cruzi]RNC60040.1 hypothetical protein TcCL_ESM02255 [Trypanosoma cruzi]|eukprot:XP_819744.1 hypothetical protein [Trypanosoma cruzi strain CL Brener]
MTMAVKELPPLRSTPAIDRLRDAKRRFALNESQFSSSRLGDRWSASPRMTAQESSQKQPCTSSSSSAANAATNGSGGRREGTRHATLPFSGLSSIHRHVVGDSDTNSLLTWTLFDSNCRNTPRGSAPIMTGVDLTPTVASSFGVPGSEEAGSTAPQVVGSSGDGADSGRVFGSDGPAAMPTASCEKQKHYVSDVPTHDIYRQRYNSQRVEMSRREDDYRRRRDANRAEVAQLISHTTRLGCMMNLQRQIYNEIMKRPLRTLAATEPVMNTAAPLPSKRSSFPPLFLSIRREAEGEASDPTKVESGVQVALKLLKSRFASGCYLSTNMYSKPLFSVPAAAPTLETPLEAAGELPSAAGAKSTEKVVGSGGENEKSHNDDNTKRECRGVNEEFVHASSSPHEHEEAVTFHSSLVMDSATAPTMIYESCIHHASGRKEEENPTSASQRRDSSETLLTEEEQRGLRLLSTVRGLRRQTEELTTAVLHAAGEWGCWDSPGTSVFRGLFLSPRTAMCIVEEEKAAELRLMHMAALEEAARGGVHPVTAALRQQCPFRRSLPPPPSVLVQMEMFNLPGMRRQIRRCQERQHHQRQRQEEANAKDGNTREAIWRPFAQHVLLPEAAEHFSKTEEEAEERGKQRLQQSPVCVEQDADPVDAPVDVGPPSQLATNLTGIKMGEQHNHRSSFASLKPRHVHLFISSSSSSSSSYEFSFSSSYLGSQSSTEDGRQTASAYSYASSALLSTNMKFSVAALSEGEESASEAQRGIIKERKKEKEEESEMRKKENIPYNSQREVLPLDRRGLAMTKSSDKPTSTSLGPQVAEELSGTAVVPIFRAEAACEQSHRGNKERKSLAKRLLSFFGACSCGGSRGTTVSGRKRRSAAS